MDYTTTTVGTEITMRHERPYTVGGERKVHRYTYTATVVEIDSLGWKAEVSDVRDETDRPDFAKYPAEILGNWGGDEEIARRPAIPDHEDEGLQSIVLCPRDMKIHHATRTPKGERRCGGCGRKAV